jgi:hypothetical protein
MWLISQSEAVPVELKENDDVDEQGLDGEQGDA